MIFVKPSYFRVVARAKIVSGESHGIIERSLVCLNAIGECRRNAIACVYQIYDRLRCVA